MWKWTFRETEEISLNTQGFKLGLPYYSLNHGDITTGNMNM